MALKMQALCSACINRCTGSSGALLQKRLRYYWAARPQTKERALLMQVTLPRLNKKKEDLSDDHDTDDQLYGLDVLLRRDVEQIFSTSKLVAVLMYTHHMQTSDDYYYVRYELQQHGMNMQKFPRHVLEATLRDTKFVNLCSLFGDETALVYGDNADHISHLLQAVKKYSKYMQILGALVDDRLVSLDQLIAYSRLPSLDETRAQLSATLRQAVASTSGLLQRPALQLTCSLHEHGSSPAGATE